MTPEWYGDHFRVRFKMVAIYKDKIQNLTEYLYYKKSGGVKSVSGNTDLPFSHDQLIP